MNFSQGHSGTKVQYMNRFFFKEKVRKTPEFTKIGEIHDFFGLVCRATPETTPESWKHTKNYEKIQNSPARIQGRALYGPMPVKGETFREL